MSFALLEQGAQALGDLRGEVVFVGGATLTLWITDPAAPPLRVTKDVDVVVETTSPLQYRQFEDRLRGAGFREYPDDGVICRWQHRASGLLLDAMPADPGILGFANRWQAAALPHAVSRELPSGRMIRAVPPAYLLGTKLEAFKDRGHEDFLASADFADVVVLIDGRDAIAREVRDAPPELREYLADELVRLAQHPRFADGLYAALPGDSPGQSRVESVVRPRLSEIVDARP